MELSGEILIANILVFLLYFSPYTDFEKQKFIIVKTYSVRLNNEMTKVFKQISLFGALSQNLIEQNPGSFFAGLLFHCPSLTEYEIRTNS